MLHSRAPLVPLALTVLMTATNAAFVTPLWAQDAPPAGQPSAPQPPQPRQPQTLQEVVEEVVWKPEQQGVLIIIAPDKVYRQMKAEFTEDGTYIPPQQKYLPPKSPDGLRVFALEDYFPYRVAPCGDVTVFAPAKMHILNYRNLPKPSAYAGFKPADSFRLLQASLTDAQWRQISGAGGLGLSDLDPDQRELFLAALPQPLVVRGTFNGKSETTSVTDNQRRGIRLRMAREMGWFFQQENGGGIGIGRGSQENNLSVVMREQFDWESRQRKAFGAELVSEVPAHFKPGQLAFDWEGLNADVDLRNVKTIGDLVGRVREATRVELYCDPRYARLPVYLRGDSARAGNLLKAIARGVTGTWRRLENAYVLTDDLTGLAVRHALIADWVAQNTALASQVDRKIAQALHKARPGKYVQYEEGDPLKPSDALLTKYQKHQASLRAPRKEGDPQPEWNKVWPVADLPTEAQETIKKQIKEFADGRFGPQSSKVNPDAVQLTFNSVLKWEIPGIGTVPSPYSADVISVSDEQDNIQAQIQAQQKIQAQPLPALLKSRALIMKPGKENLTEKVLQAAQRAGFTEIWVETEAGNAAAPAALTTITQRARRVGLGTRAVVSALRRHRGKEGGAGVDTNLLGETYTQYLDRQLQAAAWPRNPWESGYSSDNSKTDVVNPAEIAARRQRERGDWLDPATPGTESSIAAVVAEIAKIPDLNGVVLRDLTPPGYGATPDRSSGMESADAGAQGGFSLARRAAFLRQFGVDPLDLSLTGANGFNRYYLRFRESNYTQLELPFFPDYGVNAANTTINGVNATQLGAGSSLDEWNRFRREDAERAVKRIQTRAQAAAGKLPVWFYQNKPEAQMYWAAPSYVENRDKPTPDPASTTVPATAPTPGNRDYNPFLPPAPARALSSTLLFALDMGAMTGSMPGDPQQNFLMMTGYLFNPKNTPLKGWDGMVLDMSGETSVAVVTLLDALPAPKPPGEANAVKKAPRAVRP